MTTLDELIVASTKCGLDDDELRRLLLAHRDGESADQTLARLFPRARMCPLDEQLALETS
jgi:hypothetical protein